MNLIVGAPWWLVALLATALIAAAIEDAVRLRISNVTCGSVLLLCVLAMTIRGFPVDLWRNVVVFGVVLAVGTLGFSARLLGGGDVKLFAAVALWTNFSAAIWLAAAVFLSGGALAVLFILIRPMRRRTSKPSGRYGSYGIPYGMAIVAGAFLIFGAQLSSIDGKAANRSPMDLPPL